MFTEKLFAECVASSEAQLAARARLPIANERSPSSQPASPMQSTASTSNVNNESMTVNDSGDGLKLAQDAESSVERTTSGAAQLLETELLVLAPWCGNIALDDLKELSPDAFLKASDFAACLLLSMC